MPAYFIAQINIQDWVLYEKYLSGTDVPLKQFGAEVLVVEDQPNQLEGEWPFIRTVIIRFPDMEAAQAWYHSPEYQKTVKFRHQSATTNAILVNGLSVKV